MAGVSSLALLATLLSLFCGRVSGDAAGTVVQHGLDPDQEVSHHGAAQSSTRDGYAAPTITFNHTAPVLSAGKPLKITNLCPDTIHPGLVTQAGIGPDIHGFELKHGASRTLTVGTDWQGRVWGRTNCSFNAQGTGAANRGGYNGGGKACMTGDCNGVLDCRVSGDTPVTLAEFQLMGWNSQSFYDLSLVDGYNVPMGIAVLATASGRGSASNVPLNESNVACVGTAALMAESSYNPYRGDTSRVLGTNASHPLPLELEQSLEFVSRWCPWDLLVHPPTQPEDGVYAYPDNDIPRPDFTPCYSACAKYNKPSDCCTGEYGSASTCKPGSYSKNAKAVCPDAYSYAYDDEGSTFAVPEGVGFEVVFCPLGRSTNILATRKLNNRLFDAVREVNIVEDATVDCGAHEDEGSNKSRLQPRAPQSLIERIASSSPERSSLLPRPASFWALVIAVAYLVGAL